MNDPAYLANTAGTAPTNLTPQRAGIQSAEGIEGDSRTVVLRSRLQGEWTIR